MYPIQTWTWEFSNVWNDKLQKLHLFLCSMLKTTRNASRLHTSLLGQEFVSCLTRVSKSFNTMLQIIQNWILQKKFVVWIKCIYSSSELDEHTHWSGCVFTAVCVCVCVCVCTLDGINSEHNFRVWVTILGHVTSLSFLFFSFLFFSFLFFSLFANCKKPCKSFFYYII